MPASKANISSGMARPSAWGQAMTRVVTVKDIAVGRSAKITQAIKAVKAAKTAI